MPSFAIEVPGEANPLTEGTLVHTLQAASSSDPNQIQTGAKQLQQWEKTSPFYRHLQSAYLDSRLPVEVRHLAIIQLKNGIDKYWRKTALNAVPKEDKEVIRARLVDGILNEFDNRLALQNALVIAKISRYEYPNDWPEAVSAFVSAIREASALPLQRARALLALLHIVKELSTGRLQRTRQYLQAATPEIVAVVGNLYAQIVQQWQQSPNADNMHQSLLAIKLVRRLLVFGYEHPCRESDVISFWTLSLDQLGSFIPLLESAMPADIKLLLGRHTLQLAKLHHEMVKNHPASYPLLPNSLQLTQSYWGLVKEFGNTFGSKDIVATDVQNAKIGSEGDVADQKSVIEKISLKGLLIIRACVKMVHSPAETFRRGGVNDKNEKNQATETIRNTLLTEAFVREAMETLVLRFFVFRTSDLREWQEEPEEWEKREEGDGEDWEFSIRTCAEKLFLDLAINYRSVILEPLLAVFYQVASPQIEDILFKDSVYTAVGLAAPVIKDNLDFDAFIRDVLIAEVQKHSPGWNIIRRRVAILLGKWVPIKVGDQCRPLVYQIFQHLLNASDPLNDQVVRVTAGRQLMNVANEWEFDVQQFLPYAETILTQLMQLIGEVELTETKMALLNTISVIVERLDHQISPYAERIVSLLPGLWEDSGEEHLMKQSILAILGRLVNGMRADSLPLHRLVFPIIKGAVEPGSEMQVYLLEDSLDLWGAVLAQTPSNSTSSDLLDLMQYLYPIYELGSDNLRKALEITESYLLLAPQHVLSPVVRRPLLLALADMLGSLKAQANGLVCNLIENMVRLSPRSDVQTAMPAGPVSEDIMDDLVRSEGPESSVLSKLLFGLHGSWRAHCTTGPNATHPPVDGIMETDYYAILARCILGFHISKFTNSCDTACEHFSERERHKVLDWLMEEWFSHLENIGDPGRRKLMCLALTKLLETEYDEVLHRLQSFMTMWTDVVTELREDAADVSGDSLVMIADLPPYAEGPEGPEDVRRRQLTFSDDVHTVNLPQFIKHHLQQVVQKCGGDEEFEKRFLVDVDRDVVKAFSQLGIM